MENKYGHLDKLTFAQLAYQKSGAKPTGHCARYIWTAMSSAGLNLPLMDAWLYSHEKSSVLQTAGFVQVSPVGYQPQIGDLVIWLPCLGKPVPGHPTGTKHVHGHIQVYTGRSDYPWVSDFKQHDKSLPGLPSNTGGWKSNRAVYEIYRYIG